MCGKIFAAGRNSGFFQLDFDVPRCDGVSGFKPWISRQKWLSRQWSTGRLSISFIISASLRLILVFTCFIDIHRHPGGTRCLWMSSFPTRRTENEDYYTNDAELSLCIKSIGGNWGKEWFFPNFPQQGTCQIPLPHCLQTAFEPRATYIFMMWSIHNTKKQMNYIPAF